MIYYDIWDILKSKIGFLNMFPQSLFFKTKPIACSQLTILWIFYAKEGWKERKCYFILVSSLAIMYVLLDKNYCHGAILQYDFVRLQLN